MAKQKQAGRKPAGMKIKKGDTVVVLAGRDRGREGTVIAAYPDRPLTKKPAETRMGSGKGSPEWWVANVKPGRVMFELSGVPEPVAREALRLAAHKLPMLCWLRPGFVTREGVEV